MVTVLDPIEKLNRDLQTASRRLSDAEARYLVDYYYIEQENRKRLDNQVRSMEGEPSEILGWLAENTRTFENNIKKALESYSLGSPVGQWAQSIRGIGPVISAGLMAHIDIEKAVTVGHIWSFAGLDPNQEWKKGEKRPWNAALKTLCWKIGESFVKVHNHEEDVYGHLYMERKAKEALLNDAGVYAEQAAAKLERFRIGKDTEAYKAYSAGKLPPGHINARAKRWATKIFLSHWHHVAFENATGTVPPIPWVIANMPEHVHLIDVPNHECAG